MFAIAKTRTFRDKKIENSRNKTENFAVTYSLHLYWVSEVEPLLIVIVFFFFGSRL